MLCKMFKSALQNVQIDCAKIVKKRHVSTCMKSLEKRSLTSKTSPEVGGVERDFYRTLHKRNARLKGWHSRVGM